MGDGGGVECFNSFKQRPSLITLGRRSVASLLVAPLRSLAPSFPGSLSSSVSNVFDSDAVEERLRHADRQSNERAYTAGKGEVVE